MKPSEILSYYLRDDVIQKLINTRERECAVRYGEIFGKRPAFFQYHSEIEKVVKMGATSFHVSEERWQNPLLLRTDMKKEDFNSLRSGWDILIDIDCKQLEVSKIFCKMIAAKFEKEGVNTFSIKFSGGSGFHMLVPYESFPEAINGEPINKLFPDASMIVSIYLKNELKNTLSDALEKDFGLQRLSKMFGIDASSLAQDGYIDPYKIIDIDTVLISERHMFRMQYSLNEKKWLVSVPIKRSGIDSFTIKDAEPNNIDTRIDFFDLKVRKNEAERLFVRAYDSFEPKIIAEKDAVKKSEYKEYNLPINLDKLPPCIKAISAGISDGKKRSVFILINFYRSIGKTREEINNILTSWNTKNSPPLKGSYIQSQLDYAFGGRRYPPPNCDAEGYYKYFNVCSPDETCKRIKNPLSYYLKMASPAKRNLNKVRKNV